jgi:hypothetical protein
MFKLAEDKFESALTMLPAEELAVDEAGPFGHVPISLQVCLISMPIGKYCLPRQRMASNSTCVG